jgi:hypothetical protein
MDGWDSEDLVGWVGEGDVGLGRDGEVDGMCGRF